MAQNDWRSVVPEEYRDVGLVKNANDIGGFFKSVKDLDVYRGNSVRLPSEGASDEERGQIRDKLLKHFEQDIMMRPDFENDEQARTFYQTLGMPPEPSGYKLPEVEGIAMPEDRDAAFRSLAHKAGLTDKQFNTIMQGGMELDKNTLAEMKTKADEGMAGLKADWGLAFEERSNSAKKFIEERLPSLNSDMLPPQAIREIWDIAKDAYAGGSQLDSGGSVERQLDVTEAGEQIGELRRNKEFMDAYYTKSNPGHIAAKQKMSKLYKAASASENDLGYSVYGVG